MMEYAYRTLIGELSLENEKLKNRISELENKSLLSFPSADLHRINQFTPYLKQKEAA